MILTPTYVLKHQEFTKSVHKYTYIVLVFFTNLFLYLPMRCVLSHLCCLTLTCNLFAFLIIYLNFEWGLLKSILEVNFIQKSFEKWRTYQLFYCAQLQRVRKNLLYIYEFSHSTNSLQKMSIYQTVFSLHWSISTRKY